MMRAKLLLSDNELQRFTDSTDWAEKAYALFLQQQESWDLLEKNYGELSNVKTKDFAIDGHTYRVQFNPGRIVSSSAKVDEQSIRERKCFLCSAHLPSAQRGLEYDSDYLILCNPFPIFSEHFTIPHREHVPQQIRTSFPALLRLTRDFSGRYCVLYNGPKCGASAPDHLHFQAGERGFIPLEDEYEEIITRAGEKIADIDGLLVFAVGDFLRRFISLESDNEHLLAKAFEVFYRSWQAVSANADEPLMNIISSYEEGEWRVMVFPRAQHRPSFFFAEGERKMLISPAAVDLGGVITVPIEKDFGRINERELAQTFEEVVISPSDFRIVKERLSLGLTALKG